MLFGIIDTWLILNLTGEHVTDVTNASRTMLMNLKSLDWDKEIFKVLGIPRAMLLTIKSSSEIYGYVAGFPAQCGGEMTSPLRGIPIAGDLGDQQLRCSGRRVSKQAKRRTRMEQVVLC
ncbi:MAG: FGGY family carbohydrate kinase [Anaerolineales bacterium]